MEQQMTKSEIAAAHFTGFTAVHPVLCPHNYLDSDHCAGLPCCLYIRCTHQQQLYINK